MKIHYLSENTPSGALVSMDYGGPSCVMVTQMLLSVTDVEPRERHGVTLTKNMHNQADDLTAERAAALLEKCMKMGWAFNGSYTEGQGHYVLAQALKTARQEALREASRMADEYGAKEWDKGIQDAMARLSLRLDRLASEGGT